MVNLTFTGILWHSTILNIHGEKHTHTHTEREEFPFSFTVIYGFISNVTISVRHSNYSRELLEAYTLLKNFILYCDVLVYLVLEQLYSVYTYLLDISFFLVQYYFTECHCTILFLHLLTCISLHCSITHEICMPLLDQTDWTHEFDILDTCDRNSDSRTFWQTAQFENSL